MYCTFYFKSRICRLAVTEDVYGKNDEIEILDEVGKVFDMPSLKVIKIEDRNESKEEGVRKSQRVMWDVMHLSK